MKNTVPKTEKAVMNSSLYSAYLLTGYLSVECELKSCYYLQPHFEPVQGIFGSASLRTFPTEA